MGAHGEICAKIPGSSKDVVQAWMDSDAHRKAMLDDHYKSVAVGCYVDSSGILYCVELLSSDEV